MSPDPLNSSPAPIPPRLSSSPRRVRRHFAEHKRNEVQAFAYDEKIHNMSTIKTRQDFLTFLSVPDDHLPRMIPTEPESHFTFRDFVKAANTMAKFMKDEHFPNADLLVFKSTGNHHHPGHVTDTRCRPDYTAAYQGHWGGKNTTHWSFIRLVGEAASKGKTLKEQEGQAISYLHYLLLTRPDLHVAQGLFTDESKVMFLFGIGGLGVNSFAVSWGNKHLYRLMYAFVYRLYDPGDFADSSYVQTELNPQKNVVTYTVQITVMTKAGSTTKIICPNLASVYASNPFGTRTHVFLDRDSKVEVNGEPLTVLKDQLCRVGTRFDEHSILKQSHNPEKVPGVVEPVYHALLDVPHCKTRQKHRMGLRQYGRPFAAISTLQSMLEVVFDILEVLRYLRFERSVLHRDISKGNVLHYEDNLPSPTDARSDAQSGGLDEAVGPKEVPLCFIKYLLGESNDPKKTSALLIDFNHAEDLMSKQGSEHKRTTRTGTPVFIARAVELGGPVSLPDGACIIPAVPESPEPYAFNHPERIKKFPFAPDLVRSPDLQPSMDCQWRHELDHDTESVFWLLLYWAVSAQPEEDRDRDRNQEELINAGIWADLTGPAESRVKLVGSRRFGGATHSIYRPLWPLLNKLAAILDIDRHWVKSSDPRNDPGYLTEAFQRLILQFILDNRNEKFMKCKVGRHFRRPEPISANSSVSVTRNWTTQDEMTGNLSLPGSSASQGEMKRFCINATADGTILEVPPDAEGDEDWPMTE